MRGTCVVVVVCAGVIAAVANGAARVARAGNLQVSQVAASVALAVPSAASATPSIAVSGDRVAVAWGARAPSGATDVYVAVSGDGARTFGAPARANDAPGSARLGGELPPRVAFAGDVIWVLWTARDAGTSIRIARSDDGGRTFASARELQRSGAAGDRGWPALAADGRHGVHAIWLDHRGLAAPAPGGAVHHGHDRSAASHADGAAMAQKSALFYSSLDGEREITRGVCYCCKTALAIAGDGSVAAAWRHVYPGNIRDIAFTISRDGGRTFAPPARVSQDEWQLEGCPDDGPALAVDAQGRSHIVWPTVTSTPEPHKAIFYATTSDGRTFTPRARVSPQGRNTAHPQIAVDGERVWVLWDEIVNARRRVFMSTRAPGGTFAAPLALSGEVESASYPVAAVVGGTLVAAWVEGSPSDSRIIVRRIMTHR